MTIPARYSLTEAHFRIAELEQTLELIYHRIVIDGHADSYDGTTNPVIAKDIEAVLPDLAKEKA